MVFKIFWTEGCEEKDIAIPPTKTDFYSKN